MSSQALLSLAESLSSEAVDGCLEYGTAGFRAEASRLRGAMMRIGALAALRSVSCHGAATGVMVTASHNPDSDNGAKIVDPAGSMLAPAWETHASSFVNTNDISTTLSTVQAELLSTDAAFDKAVVVVGADTRPSSTELIDMVINGVRAVNNSSSAIVNLGTVTTPQLHFVVRSKNRGDPCTVSDYTLRLATAYCQAVPRGAPPLPVLRVDCANGVGSHALSQFEKLLPNMILLNRDGDGKLNDKCGADYVQKNRKMPVLHGLGHMTNIHDACVRNDGSIWASLDGDADRLVMFVPQHKDSSNDVIAKHETNSTDIRLADGDRFAALVAMYISKHMKNAGIDGMEIGVGQTAYSNGAATEYMQALDFVNIVTTWTGVKHLERVANKFDVGIYWEPNGHGTVMFSDSFIEKLIFAYEESDENSSRRTSAGSLLAVACLANPAVGDGVADLLLILAILQCERMSFSDWISLYAERCSENLIVRVANKDVIVTDDFDRRVVKPEALRKVVENVANVSGRRVFVRPSGTEDVIRVYAEAPNGCEAEAHNIAVATAQAVYDTCGGVGPLPQGHC